MRTYIFFEEGRQDAPEFEVQAKNYNDAYYVAYACYGPQVEDLYYCLKPDAPEVPENPDNLKNPQD